MNFGEKLRKLRQDRSLTQPDVAQSLGIEQSYLSKLENGKAVPSNETLERVLEVFGLTLGDLVDDLDQGARNKLRQLPAVAEHFNQQRAMIIGDRRRWLIASTFLVALGAALIYAGSVHLAVGRTIYSYGSPGVVLDGESTNIFRNYRGIDDSEFHEQIRAREDWHYVQTRSYRGQMFNVPVEEGSRTYYLEERPVFPVPDAWQNKAVATFGVLLLVLGTVGIILEKKLSRYQ